MILNAGSIHFFMAGKGGIGKTLSSLIFAQILMRLGRNVDCFDVDPLNASLASYKALDAEQIDLTKDGKIDSQKLDELVVRILASHHDCIIDNGTSSFLSFLNYLIENDVLTILNDEGRNVFVHIVVTGGPPMQDTITGFESLITQIPKFCKVIVWINEFYGEPVVYGEPEDDGKPVRIDMEDLALFAAFSDQIVAFIRIKERSKETFGRDFSHMLERHLTFDEAIDSPEFSLMSRQRLTMIRRHIQEQIEELINE